MGRGHRDKKGETMSTSVIKSLEQCTIQTLQGYTTFAARWALGQGLSSDEVARVLEDLAHAVREPGDVAEDMSPITLDDI